MIGGIPVLVKHDVTEPLANGDLLPSHPANTTSLKITNYGEVRDAEDGIVLHGGLHQNEIRTLALGQQMSLTHLYRFAIRDKKIFHTRPAVIIDVECVEV